MSEYESIEDDKEIGEDPQGVVKKWLTCVDMASKREKEWRKHAKEVEDRYKGNTHRPIHVDSPSSTHNILWANIETLRPTLYNRTPRPDVRRRFRDDDRSGRTVADVINRCLAFSLDSYDFDEVMLDSILDLLVVGRAVVRVKYIPQFVTEKDDQDEEYERLDYEDVKCELVQWDDFRMGPGKQWKDVQWVAFLHRMEKEELLEKFGKELAGKVTLDSVPENTDEDSTDNKDKELYKRAKVWEIWDKEDRKVYFIAESYIKAPLSTNEDPLGLEGFYPVPRPLYAVNSTTSTLPVPEYHLYESQARELDDITSRISYLIAGLKLRGIYDSSISELSEVMRAEENELIPASNVTSMRDSGGLDKVIWFMPMEAASKVLKELYVQREQIKQTIYEITGLSDILRGVSNPNETAKAQEIKRQFGGKRIERRQRDVQRMIRDILRIKTELIAKKFQPDTIIKMSGINMQPQDMQVMKNNALREFRIDIETNSTIALDEQEDQQSMSDLMGAISGFVKEVGPMVQAGVMPMELAKKLLAAVVRRFRMGKDLEELLEMPAPQVPNKPDPAMAKAQAEQQHNQAMVQLEQGKMAADQQRAQAQMAVDKQRNDAEMAMKKEELNAAREKAQMELQLEREKAQMEMQLERDKAKAQITIDREKAQVEMQFEREKMAMEKEKLMMEMQMKEKAMAHEEMCAARDYQMKCVERDQNAALKLKEINNAPASTSN